MNVLQTDQPTLSHIELLTPVLNLTCLNLPPLRNVFCLLLLHVDIWPSLWRV